MAAQLRENERAMRALERIRSESARVAIATRGTALSCRRKKCRGFGGRRPDCFPQPDCRPAQPPSPCCAGRCRFGWEPARGSVSSHSWHSRHRRTARHNWGSSSAALRSAVDGFAASVTGVASHWPCAESDRPQAQHEQADEDGSENRVSALHGICSVRHFCPQSSLNLTQNPACEASRAKKWPKRAGLPSRHKTVSPSASRLCSHFDTRLSAMRPGVFQSRESLPLVPVLTNQPRLAQGKARPDSMHNSGTTVACCRLLTRQRTDSVNRGARRRL